MAGTKLCCLVTEAHGCEQLAQGNGLARSRTRDLSITSQRPNHLATEPPVIRMRVELRSKVKVTLFLFLVHAQLPFCGKITSSTELTRALKTICGSSECWPRSSVIMQNSASIMSCRNCNNQSDNRDLATHVLNAQHVTVQL